MDDCKKIFNDLKMEAENHKPLWKDVQSFIAPTRGSFDRMPNEKKVIDHQKLLDSHATWCLKVFSSGLTSGLTSPSRPWFKLSLPDTGLMKFRPVREYLEDVQKIMLDVFSKSNIYGILNTGYEELGAFGTMACALEEDFNDFVRGKSFTAGEYYIGTDAKGRTNQFGREFYMTVLQIVDEFGIEHVSDDTRRLFNEKKYQIYRKVRHYIGPNHKRNVTKQDNKNMEFFSKYWEVTSDGHMLRDSGFEWFPIVAARWGVTTTSDVYGYGPSVEALGDVKMLQKLQRQKLESVEKVNNPPMQIDASVDDVNTFPGGITRSSSNVPNAGARAAYQISPDINAIRMTIEDTKQSISKFFYTDMFLMMQGDTRSGVTAREIVERHEEKLLMLGPMLERIENEMLDPMIDISYNYLNKMGMLPPPPKELEGMDINVEYVSMLAQAQKMVGTTAIQQATQFVGGLASVKPEVLDVLDFDEAAIEYSEMLGVSTRIIRTKEEVRKLREERAQAQQQAAQMEQMQAAMTSAKTLSDTKINNNSALDALMGVRPDA